MRCISSAIRHSHFCPALDAALADRYYSDMKRSVQNVSSYFAVFDPAKEGGYDVSFPDFPGCVTFGKTFEDAKEKGQEVLELWLEELAAENHPLPPRTARPIVDEIQVALPVG